MKDQHQELLKRPSLLSWTKKRILKHLNDGWWLETIPLNYEVEWFRGRLCWVRIDPIWPLIKEKHKEDPDYQQMSPMLERFALEGMSLHWHRQAWTWLEANGYLVQVNDRWQLTSNGKELHEAVVKYLASL